MHHALYATNTLINELMIQFKLYKLITFPFIILTFFLVYNFHSNSYWESLEFNPTSSSHNVVYTESPTNISHIIFAIAGSSKGLPYKGPYIDLWWQPNKTRGFLWLDKAPPSTYTWPSTSPPFRVSENTTKFKQYDKHGDRSTIRMSRMIVETFKEEGLVQGMRWFVKADDDTIYFVDNLVEVLAEYDHNGYHYIGGNSECIAQNHRHSFNMAFGGGGFALSYPLAKALASNVDGCIRRYSNVYGEDHLVQSCVSELGVSFTREPGIHQTDLHGDISGFLSSHPQAPIISLHHINKVNPIFPSMSRFNAIKLLMQAANTDSSRLLQQTFCYDLANKWSVMVSWGYTVHIYEKLYPPSVLQIPFQTFSPWSRRAKPEFMFNVRPLPRNPCLMPHVFYLENSVVNDATITVSDYVRKRPWKLLDCSNHSAQSVMKIVVFASSKRLKLGGRRECCDIRHFLSKNVTAINIRACRRDEVLIWSDI